MDAWALTDHGNGNGLAHARSAAVKLQKKGVKYRQLYGVEFYFVSSLSQWREDYETHKQEVKDAKEKKRSKKSDEDDVEQGGHVVEDESETKAEQTSEKPEWQRRYHLVAVAKNYEGLANINRLVKASFKDGFYRYPRIDFDMIEKWGKGIVWSSGCIGGYLARIVSKGEKLGKSRAQILSDLEEACGEFQTRVDPDSFFLELQFNKLDFQHLVNGYLIDLSKKTGIKLVSTCDSHYPSPDKWEARELYKKLGWMGDKLDKGALPKFEDLKCELYPKNAVQMWDEYKKGLESHQEVYEGSEELVRDSIERTHDIAWQMCEDTWVDTSPKLPHFGKPGNSAMKQLVSLLKKKMSEQGFDNDQRYVDRLKEELTVVKAKKFEDYFLTLHAIFQKASARAMIGPARGCFTPMTRVKMEDGLFSPICAIKEGDKVLDETGTPREVKGVFSYDVDEEIIDLTFDDGTTISCTKDHKFKTARGWIAAIDLTDDDIIDTLSWNVEQGQDMYKHENRE